MHVSYAHITMYDCTGCDAYFEPKCATFTTGLVSKLRRSWLKVHEIDKHTFPLKTISWVYKQLLGTFFPVNINDTGTFKPSWKPDVRRN